MSNENIKLPMINDKRYGSRLVRFHLYLLVITVIFATNCTLNVAFGQTANNQITSHKTNIKSGTKSGTIADNVLIFGDAFLRYENVDLDNFALDANGLTLGGRLGAEVGLSSRFSFLIEGEGVIGIVDDFNDGSGNNLTRPIIADPNNLELNRLQLHTKLDDKTFITIGRQTLAIDDQRFIGQAPFRQNRQTFDAVHFSRRTARGNTFQAGYFNQVNRALGNDNPLGRFRGDSYFFNANIGTPLGRFGAFHYALDLETGPPDALNNHFSSRTSGVRYDGRWHADEIGLDVEAAFAHQTDFAENPVDFAAHYWLAGAQLFFHDFRLGARFESLGSDNGESFQTPTGTLHRFQGEADIFLITPQEGVFDQEISAIWEIGTVGIFKNISSSVRYHWFDAVTIDADYGSEVDFRFGTTINNLRVTFILADYNADSFAQDSQRIFLSLSKRF